MDVDLRIPVGLLFITIGLVMGIFGLVSDPVIYAKSLGINVNLDWGAVELIFGALMIVFGRRAESRVRTAPATAHVPLPKPVVALRPDLPPEPLPRKKPPVPHG